MTTEEAVANATETAPAASEYKTRAVPSEVQPEVPSPEPEPETPAAETPPEEVETPAESQADTDEPDAEDGEQQPEERKPLPKGVQRKINKLTRRVGEFADENRELKDRLAQLESGQVQEKPTDAKPASDEPKLEDFDFDPAAFNRAHYKWLREQEKQSEAVQTRQQKFSEQEAAFRAEHPDYDDIAKSPDVPITRDMVLAIVDTENPPAIAYYLGQNPEEAQQIAQMTALAAARAIGRIEAKLAEPPRPAPVLPKKTTNAPPPPKTVSGAGKPEVSVDDPSLSTAQRIALWKQQRR